ncbi:D-alanyl-D-alanine carboxypeptidase [uncultured Caudovirales phage]|uniref:D-alanyl-D-alanine carboxypeptidase n=1 Tax=uncultured Caudovirales phage TaxID=2100421 RepID=A0A6J5NV55_9CAUD|nr:D-alanyl-D-alanine carboxypeptidase [uncultured Caudovirales phage]
MTKLLSQNGWPASKDPAEIGIKSYPIKGTNIKIRCAAAVAPLLTAFVAEFHKLIEPINEGSLDDFGYNFRLVRGSEIILSNHGSGTAVDLNSKDHPLGKSGTFPAEKVPIIRELCTKYSILWGGDFRHRKDEMHFEILGGASKVEALIGSMKQGETK